MRSLVVELAEMIIRSLPPKIGIAPHRSRDQGSELLWLTGGIRANKKCTNRCRTGRPTKPGART